METDRPSEKGFQTACYRIVTDRLISTILNRNKLTMIKTKRNAEALLLRMMLYKIICWQQMQRHQQQFRQQMQQPPWLMWEDRQVPQPKPQGVQVDAKQPYVQEANALTQLGLLSQGGSHSSVSDAVQSTPQPSSQVPHTQTTSASPTPFPSQVLEVPDSSQVSFSGVSDSFSVATDVSQVSQSQQNTQVSPVSADSSGNGSVMAFFPM